MGGKPRFGSFLVIEPFLSDNLNGVTPFVEHARHVDDVGDKIGVRRKAEELVVLPHGVDDLTSRVPLLEVEPQVQEKPRTHDVLADAV
jgi:hypothetical protein